MPEAIAAWLTQCSAADMPRSQQPIARSHRSTASMTSLSLDDVHRRRAARCASPSRRSCAARASCRLMPTADGVADGRKVAMGVLERCTGRPGRACRRRRRRAATATCAPWASRPKTATCQRGEASGRGHGFEADLVEEMMKGRVALRVRRSSRAATSTTTTPSSTRAVELFADTFGPIARPADRRCSANVRGWVMCARPRVTNSAAASPDISVATKSDRNWNRASSSSTISTPGARRNRARGEMSGQLIVAGAARSSSLRLSPRGRGTGKRRR